MSKHLVSRVPRARQQIPRLDGPVFPSSQDRRHLSFSGGGPVRPSTCPGKGKLGGETRLPMVRKIIQWVPIDGTRWRNEFVNGHENHGVGLHQDVAHRGVVPTLRAIGSGPSKGICSQYASINPEDARSHHGIYLLVKTRRALKNSLLRNPQKLDGIKMPCKRFSARLTSLD